MVSPRMRLTHWNDSASPGAALLRPSRVPAQIIAPPETTGPLIKTATFSDKNPWYARIGLLYAMYGCFGGVGFGFEGLYSMIFAVGDKIGVVAQEKFPLQMNLALYWSGPAFPLSMLILGIMLIYRRISTPIVGTLFILGAIAFPVSRISRAEWVAHLADLILLGGVVLLALGTAVKSRQ